VARASTADLSPSKSTSSDNEVPRSKRSEPMVVLVDYGSDLEGDVVLIHAISFKDERKFDRE
jgi:hypothetical protein